MKRILFLLLVTGSAAMGQKVVIKSNPVAINADSVKDGAVKAAFLQTEKAKLAATLDSSSLKNALRRIRTVTANATVLVTDVTVVVNATSGSVTLTLPAASSFAVGTILNIKKVDASANTVTIDANASELIDGALTYILTDQWEGINIQTNGTAWFII